ncbi:hypothetical protein ScPMuIL_009281 [Solemya velum]
MNWSYSLRPTSRYPDQEQSEHIRIVGTKENIEKAIHEIQCISDEQAKLAFERLPVPKVFHPFVCGPYNHIIKTLMEETGAKINVPPTSVHKDEIVVSGEKEGVLKCKTIIMRTYEERNRKCQTVSVEVRKSQQNTLLAHVEQTFRTSWQRRACLSRCPPWRAHRKPSHYEETRTNWAPLLLWSTQRPTVSSLLRCRTGLAPPIHHREERRKCQENHPDFSKDKIQVEGPPEEVTECTRALEELVRDLQSRMDFAEIAIEQRFHKHIIGKSGQNITRIKNETGVAIRIPADNENSNIIRIEGDPEDPGKKSDVVTLRGPKNDVDKCHKYLQQLHGEMIASNYQAQVHIFKDFTRTSLNTVTQNDKSLNNVASTAKHKMDLRSTDPKQFELYTVIGSGCEGAATIALAKYLPTGLPVAVKRIDLEHCDENFSTIQKEIVLCRQLKHEKIMPYLGTLVYQREIWVIMPLMAYGSCTDLINAYFTCGLPEQAVAYILKNVLQALEYLHSKAIIHRSVKGSHILISSTGRVRLSGFRHATSIIRGAKRLRAVHEYSHHAENCLQWMSPEMLQQNLLGYDMKSDIYSLGITACELANGYAPFADMQMTQMLLAKLNGTKPVLVDNTTIAELDDLGFSPSGVQDSYSKKSYTLHFHSFVDACLQSDTAKRPSATTLTTHQFFKGTKKRTAEVLPALLHPVTPLTDISKLPKDEFSVETDDLGDISIEERWLF